MLYAVYKIHGDGTIIFEDGAYDDYDVALEAADEISKKADGVYTVLPIFYSL